MSLLIGNKKTYFKFRIFDLRVASGCRVVLCAGCVLCVVLSGVVCCVFCVSCCVVCYVCCALCVVFCGWVLLWFVFCAVSFMLSVGWFPNQPTEPTEPTEPADATEPTKPTEPTEPTESDWLLHPHPPTSTFLPPPPLTPSIPPGLSSHVISGLALPAKLRHTHTPVRSHGSHRHIQKSRSRELNKICKQNFRKLRTPCVAKSLNWKIRYFKLPENLPFEYQKSRDPEIQQSRKLETHGR